MSLYNDFTKQSDYTVNEHYQSVLRHNHAAVKEELLWPKKPSVKNAEMT